MEELLRIAYHNFMDTEDTNTSESVRIINRNWKNITEALAKLEKILSTELFQEIYELISDGAGDIQEAAFIAGFSQCAKFITNGKVNFFAVQEEKDGGCDD